MKQGILLVSPGTVDRDTRKKCIDELLLSVQDRFPEAVTESAFTSGEVRRVLRNRDGEKVRNVKAALLHLHDEGVTDLAVLSVHILDDPDYRIMRGDVSGFGSLFRSVRIAEPLLASSQDADLAARALWRIFREKAGTEGIIFFSGGGAEGDQLLRELENRTGNLFGDVPVLVPSVSGSRKMRHVLKTLREREVSRVSIVPLMFMQKGLLGEEEERNTEEYRKAVALLAAAGISPAELSGGIGEYDAVQRLYLRHLYEA